MDSFLCGMAPIIKIPAPTCSGTNFQPEINPLGLKSSVNAVAMHITVNSNIKSFFIVQLPPFLLPCVKSPKQRKCYNIQCI